MKAAAAVIYRGRMSSNSTAPPGGGQMALSSWSLDYGSSRAALPRLGGDGMDSESLKHYQPLTTPPRAWTRSNLNNSDRSTSVNKRTKSKYVPHEPVKAAVKPLSALKSSSSNSSSVSVSSRPQSPSSFPGNHGKFRKSMSPTSILIPNSGSLSPISCGSPKHFSPPPASHGGSGVIQNKAVQESVVLNMSPILDKVKKHSSSPPPDEERQVEGQQSRQHGDVEKLLKEMKDIRDDLEVQLKVNSDLKKMLVAAMGEDLHCKVESLVRTKAQLATEIGGYTKKICDDYESIDQLAVLADKWRTKFMAGRVLVEQVTGQRDELQARVSESQRALQHLLQERQQLKDWMLQTHRHLKLLRDSFDPIYAKKSPPTIPNILELSRTNLLLVEGVKLALLGPINMYPTALDAGVQNGLSPAEQLAYQVLVDASESSMVTPGPVKSGAASSVSSATYTRFHPQVRYDNITFNCCMKCKGEIQVV